MEQNIVCRDADDFDYESLHCFIESSGKVIAYLRAYPDGDNVRIGRVLTLTHRKGHGRALMEFGMAEIERRMGKRKILLHSQCHAEGFYEKLGFSRCSDVFLEEGIEHVEMKWDDNCS